MTPEELTAELRLAIVDYHRLQERLEESLAEVDRLREQIENGRRVIEQALGQAVRVDRAWREWLEIECGQNPDDWWKGGEPPDYPG